MPLANTGTNVPLETISALKFALLLIGAARVTLTVYVCVVVPSWAVTITAIAFAPTASAIAPEALPLTTVLPFTLIVAFACVAVGVTVMDVTALATESDAEKLGTEICRAVRGDRPVERGVAARGRGRC